MKIVRDYICRGNQRRGEKIATASLPILQVYDVTTSATEIHLASLEVLLWAPAWMTRAERLLLYALIFGLRPQRYLEVGTYKGGSALIVAAAMEASGNDGRIVCVDPDFQIEPEHLKRLQSRTSFVRGFSPDVLPDAYQIAGGPFDFVLIDGDHTCAGVIRDANGVLPFVANGGYILFHDSFFPEVALGIDRFVSAHSDVVADFGTLTREVTTQSRLNSEPIYWGGLRMIQVRKK